MTGEESHQPGTQFRQDAPTEHNACSLITCVVQILQGPLRAEVMLSGNIREDISGAGLQCARDVTDSKTRESHVLTPALTPTFSHNPTL